MREAPARRTAQLGELVVAAFDAAARHSADPRVVLRLATLTVARLLRRARLSGAAAAVAQCALSPRAAV